jgi:hypothetical protein
VLLVASDEGKQMDVFVELSEGKLLGYNAAGAKERQ